MDYYGYISVALTFAVTLVVIWVLLLPIFSPQGTLQGTLQGKGEEWCEKEAANKEQREELLSLLQELEGDKASGKLTADEYQGNRAELLRELLPLLDGEPANEGHAPPTREQGLG